MLCALCKFKQIWNKKPNLKTFWPKKEKHATEIDVKGKVWNGKSWKENQERKIGQRKNQAYRLNQTSYYCYYFRNFITSLKKSFRIYFTSSASFLDEKLPNFFKILRDLWLTFVQISWRTVRSFVNVGNEKTEGRSCGGHEWATEDDWGHADHEGVEGLLYTARPTTGKGLE